MGFGNSTEPDGSGICSACLKPKEGRKQGPVGGYGFGNVSRTGTVAVCVNPNCQEGQKNLAEQGQQTR